MSAGQRAARDPTSGPIGPLRSTAGNTVTATVSPLSRALLGMSGEGALRSCLARVLATLCVGEARTGAATADVGLRSMLLKPSGRSHLWSQARRRHGLLVVDFNVVKAQCVDHFAVRLARLLNGATPARTFGLAQSLWPELGHLPPPTRRTEIFQRPPEVRYHDGDGPSCVC